MSAFRALLAMIFISIAVYTGHVVFHHGWGLLPVFFGDMLQMGWPGQFNFDFMCMLTLSGLWVAWRHRFSAGGIVLGLLALFGGALFLSAYLWLITARSHGDITLTLLGPARARARG